MGVPPPPFTDKIRKVVFDPAPNTQSHKVKRVQDIWKNEKRLYQAKRFNALKTFEAANLQTTVFELHADQKSANLAGHCKRSPKQNSLRGQHKTKVMQQSAIQRS